MFFLLGQSHLFGHLWYCSFISYAANDNSEKENTIRGYSHEITGFTDQRTPFTHVQEATLQSREFNLCVHTCIQPLLSFPMWAFRKQHGTILQSNTNVLKLKSLHSNLENHEFKNSVINLRFNAVLKIEIFQSTEF